MRYQGSRIPTIRVEDSILSSIPLEESCLAPNNPPGNVAVVIAPFRGGGNLVLEREKKD